MSTTEELPSYLREGFRTHKYDIRKTSGEPLHPDAKYFVLRYDKDPNAVVAMLAYAHGLVGDNTPFVKQLLQTLYIHAERFGKLAEWSKVAQQALYRLKAEPEALLAAKMSDEITA